MNINRHNYEEFFILYMDNELSEPQRREVEAFVQKNPDLKEELDLLSHFKLEADADLLYPNKEELMSSRMGGQLAPINPENYEQWFTLHLDNELTLAQQKEVIAFIEANEEVKKEWADWQKSKLQPENLVFTGKSSLYRTEETVRRIPARWWRVAAAVILLLLAGTTTVIVLNNRKNTGKDDEIVKTPSSIEKINEETPAPVENRNTTAANDQIVTDNRSGTDTKRTPEKIQDKDQLVNQTRKENLKAVLPVNDNPVVKKEEEVVAYQDVIENGSSLPRPVNRTTTEDRSYTQIQNTSNLNNTPELKTSETPLTSPVVTVNYTETSDKKNSKLRGIFRTVARTFDKRAGSDSSGENDRLLVGGLALRL